MVFIQFVWVNELRRKKKPVLLKLIRPTFLDDDPHGIYASRHPCRPNSIGLSIIHLKERVDSTLIVRGVDVLDRTPLLDIKPYIPKFDIIESASKGACSLLGELAFVGADQNRLGQHPYNCRVFVFNRTLAFTSILTGNR